MDDQFLKIFPEKRGYKGHTYPLHELWKDLPFDPADSRGARQYDDVVLARVRPEFEKTMHKLIQQSIAHFYATARQPDAEKAFAAAEKSVKDLSSQLTKKAREGGMLDRDFDQFGQNALKSLLKEAATKVKEWLASNPTPPKKSKAVPPKPDIDQVADALASLLTEFAKLDGYNVWRRSSDVKPHDGKLVASEGSRSQRQSALLSWTVPVRQWAELDVWGEDPKTKQLITKPTHKNGVVDPGYLAWLRDTLKVFDGDATVKKYFLERLAPNCIESLDLNLSAGRHKPFVFDAGQHRAPAELIGELQAIHGEIQRRLGKLLAMVEGWE